MKKQVRLNVFETNSSSIHSLTMCSKADFDRWINGELLYDKWNKCLVELTKERSDDEDNEYLTYEQFKNYNCLGYNTFVDSYTTENGECVKAFGYYGESM